MELRLLGDFQVVHQGDVVAVRGPKQRLLLAFLGLRRGQAVPADRLVDVIWGDAPPANPANALQAQVSALRKLLPEPVLITRGHGYALELREDQVDIARFDEMVRAARHLLDEGDPAHAARRLRDALALWRGPALADFADADFARVEVARLEETRLGAIEARVEADLALDRSAELVPELETLCAAHPLRERLWAHRMLALYRCGRQAEALRAFAEAREHLVGELGIEPGPELRRMEAMVLAQDDALAAPHRTAPTSVARSNLRARLTSFVGRESEVEEIADLLERNRLVTVVGPGGAGKTRLAVEVAVRCSGAYRDGVWLVELASLTDPAGVVLAMATSLGSGDATTTPDGVADPVARLVTFLTGRELLVVLDNCEHVITEAAAVVEELVGSSPGLTVLATSREALGVPGEALFPLSPLTPSAAAALFVDRARSVDRGFELDDRSAAAVADICARLDGLPLAIELAAARLRALPLGVLGARLDDRFRLLTGGARTALPRHQTLRAVVDWSYDLLFEDERRLFERLAVFPGGCTTESAEVVCGDGDLPAGEILDLLARLVDKSLVVVDVGPAGEARYRQLQILWQYARERLADRPDTAALRDRHASWYRDLAAAAEDGLRGPDGPAWRARLEAELDNLRAALDWLVERGDAAGACTLATGMAWWWFLRAEWQEAARWLADALAAPGRTTGAVERARARAWHAYFAAFVEDPGPHIERGREALEIVRAQGDPRSIGEVALLLASTLNRAQRWEEALAELEEAREANQAAGQAWGLAIHDLLVANAAAPLGRLDDAERAARSSVDRFRAVGERWALIEPMGTIAALRDARDDVDGAIEAYDRVIATTRPLELPGYLAFWLIARGALAARVGDDATAARCFGEAIELNRNPTNTAIALIGRACAAARLGAPFERTVADLRRADELFRAVGRRDGRAATLVAEGLRGIEHDSNAGIADELRRAADCDPATADLLGAAVAHAAGRRDEAAQRLRRWDGAHLPAMPGSVPAVLRPDRDRLAAALTH